MKVAAFVALVLIASALGCSADREARLFALSDGSKGSVIYRHAREQSGVADAMLPSGAQCKGGFKTVPGEVVFDEDTHRLIVHELTQWGMLILTCGPGHVIECQFSRDPLGTGIGRCRDTRGAEYSLMF